MANFWPSFRNHVLSRQQHENNGLVLHCCSICFVSHVLFWYSLMKVVVFFSFMLFYCSVSLLVLWLYLFFYYLGKRVCSLHSHTYSQKSRNHIISLNIHPKKEREREREVITVLVTLPWPEKENFTSLICKDVKQRHISFYPSHFLHFAHWDALHIPG